MSDNTIYEIAKTIGDRNNLNKEINNSFNLVVNDLKDKYISKISKVVDTQKVKVIESMNQEIKLINAMKAFTTNETQEQLDNLINIMTTVNTAKTIHTQLSIASKEEEKNKVPDNNYTDESIHNDGVYDYDGSFYNNQNNNTNTNINSNVLPLILAFVFFNNNL